MGKKKNELDEAEEALGRKLNKADKEEIAKLATRELHKSLDDGAGLNEYTVERSLKRGAGLFATKVQLKNAAIAIAIILGAILGVLYLFYYLSIELCPHVNGYLIDTAYYNFDQRTVYADCVDCKRKVAIKGDVEYEIKREVTCCQDGLRIERWTVADYEKFNTTINRRLEKLDHDMVTIEEAEEPTCMSDGRSSVTRCSMCEQLFGGEPLGSVDCKIVFFPGVEPTCQSTGLSGYWACKWCERIENEQKVLDKIDCTYKDMYIAPTYLTSGASYKECTMCGGRRDYVVFDPEIRKVYPYRIEGSGNDKYIVITGINKDTYSEIVDLPTEIDGYPVTKIGGASLNGETLSEELYTKYDNKKFQFNTALKKIVIPESIKEIEENAFYYCTGLETVEIKSTDLSIKDRAFFACHNLKNINFPEGLTYIGERAFSGCGKLGDIVLPSTLGSIGNWAFASCSSIRNLIFGENSLWSLGVGENAFNGCSRLTTVILPSTSGGSIKSNAFNNCGNIALVRDTRSLYSWSGSVNKINISGALEIETIDNKNVFVGEDKYYVYGCEDSLSAIEFDDNINGKPFEILTGALAGSRKTITSMKITTIDGWQFKDLFDGSPSNLETLTVDTADSIPSGYFSGINSVKKLNIIFRKNSLGSFNQAFQYLNNVTELTLENVPSDLKNLNQLFVVRYLDKVVLKNMTKIPSNFFTGTETSIVLPSNLKEICDKAFANCNKIVEITIPNGTTRICYGAFMDCVKLSRMVIPESVEFVGDQVFSGCNGLSYIYNLSNVDLEASPYILYNSAIVTILTSLDQTFNVYSLGDWSYTKDDDRITIISYNGDDTEIVLPSTIEGQNYKLREKLFSGRDEITSITFTNGVTNIPNNLCLECEGLKTIVLGDTITRIGDYAFSGCKKLNSVTFGNSLEEIGKMAFYKSAITSANLPNSLKTVMGFENCDNLASVTLPEGLTTIGTEAFYGCSKLTEISIPSTVTTIGESAFRSCKFTQITIPNGLTEIADYSFAYCTALTSVTIPNSVTIIGMFAFGGCRALTTITIPSGVKTLRHNAFADCSALSTINFNAENMDDVDKYYLSGTISKSVEIFANSGTSGEGITVNIGKNVRRLPGNLFYTGVKNDTGMGTCNIVAVEFDDDSICTEIGEKAFYGCGKLTSVQLPESLKKICNSAFYKCSSLADIQLPNSLEAIKSSAFWECTGLTSIQLPNSITTLGSYVFKNCTALSSVILSSGITSIPSYLFLGCTSLKNVEIPSNIKTIGEGAFSGCGVESITFSEGLETIGKNAFKDHALTSLTLPKSLKTIEYKAFQSDNNTLDGVFVSKDIELGGDVFSNTVKVYVDLETHTKLQENGTWHFYRWYLYSESEPTASGGRYWHYVDGVITEW